MSLKSKLKLFTLIYTITNPLAIMAGGFGYVGVNYAFDLFALLCGSEAYAKFVKAVGAFESGNFQSEIYKATNNAYGMNKNNRGWQNGVKVIGKYSYCTYRNIAYSIADFVEWQDGYGTSIKSFVQNSKDSAKSGKLKDGINGALSLAVYKMKAAGYFEGDQIMYVAGVQKYYSQLNVNSLRPVALAIEIGFVPFIIQLLISYAKKKR